MFIILKCIMHDDMTSIFKDLQRVKNANYLNWNKFSLLTETLRRYNNDKL